MRTLDPPPGPDDDDRYIWVDHREEETSIVEYVSDRLPEADALSSEFTNNDLRVTWRGRDYSFPIAFSTHDRYVAISSLAELLKDRYQFFILDSSLHGDTHGFYVATSEQVQSWETAPQHLVPLELGLDYFAGEPLKVPYLNHLDNNPNFAADVADRRERQEKALAEFDRRYSRPWWKFW